MDPKSANKAAGRREREDKSGTKELSLDLGPLNDVSPHFEAALDNFLDN